MSAQTAAMKTEETRPTRAAIAALLSTLVGVERSSARPRWARFPADETQFAASIIHWGDGRIAPVYDALGFLVAYKGIRLKSGAQS